VFTSGAGREHRVSVCQVLTDSLITVDKAARCSRLVRSASPTTCARLLTSPMRVRESVQRRWSCRWSI